jgi:hypothetical protein
MRTSLLVRLVLIGLPLAAVIACESSSSSPGPNIAPEAGAVFTPDASTTDASTPDASMPDAAPPPPPAKAATMVTLNVTPLQPTVGAEVTLTATVAGKTPTGSIQLKDGASDLGAPIALTAGANPSGGTATFKTSALTAGAHVISAVYAGDADDAASTSTTTSLTVTLPTTPPFDTGLDNTRVALADGSVDTHWTVKDAMGNALTAYVQTDAQGFVGAWLPPSATSKFLSPFVDTVDPGVGPFTYTTTFSLATGVNLATTTLTVSYASDNATDSITLNGQAITGVTAGSYSAFVVLPPITGPFVVGTNTISFVSSNSGGPTGFRAELDLTAN